MSIDKLKHTFRRLQWKLTLSYSAVTVSSLLVLVMLLGYLSFTKVFIPVDIYTRLGTPKFWFQTIAKNDSSLLRSLLSQHPIDTDLITTLMQQGDMTITDFEILRIGDFQIYLKTSGQGSMILIDEEKTLLGTSNTGFVSDKSIGQPLNLSILPGLEDLLNRALGGETDPEKLIVELEPQKRFYFAFPIEDEGGQEVSGVLIVYLRHLPTAMDIPDTLLKLLGRSVLVLLLAAGVIGTVFGAITARGMVTRLGRVSEVADAWSRGDFTEFIVDPIGDEITQLGDRLNRMAEQLQQFLKRSQEIAVSEERNRLARDLHDSSKQEALAASFHLGTALTLFEADPESARSHLVEADNLVDSVRRELTDLIHELRPISMNGKRLDETLNEYIIEWAHQTGIQGTLKVEGYVDLTLEQKQALYRIMQEALANVAKHSSAHEVGVELRFIENFVELCLTDDGVGFDLSQQQGGMGLDSMRERVESLHGDFNIQSEPGGGTMVCATIPVESEER